MLASNTVGAPGTHGAGVAGMHGIGVITPNFAAVAAATVGLAGLEQTPKGIMFTIGIWSIIFAAGIKPVIVLLVGNTTIGVGAAPKLHCRRAVEQTCIGIDYFPLKYKML